MRRRHEIADDESAVDLTPMLDIVFILLIFFIVTATFVREKGLDVFNPSDQPPPSVPQTTVIPIVVYVTGRNEIKVPDIRIKGLRTISRDAVRANVERARVEQPQAPVLIRADPEADMGIVVSVLDQARQAGAPAVTIEAQEQTD